MLDNDDETSVGGEDVSFSQRARAKSDTVESFPDPHRSRILAKREIKGAEKPEGSSLRLKVLASELAYSIERLRISREGKGGIDTQAIDSAKNEVSNISPAQVKKDQETNVQFPVYLILIFKSRLTKVGPAA